MAKDNLKSSVAEKPWCVYILECTNGVFYTGITNDLQARFNAHLTGKGARFTRANKPSHILASAQFPSKSVASKVEYQVKQKAKHRKISFLHQMACEHLGELQVQLNNDEHATSLSESDYGPARHRPLP